MLYGLSGDMDHRRCHPWVVGDHSNCRCTWILSLQVRYRYMHLINHCYFFLSVHVVYYLINQAYISQT